MGAPVDVCVVGSANLDLVAGVAEFAGPGETVLATTYAEHPGGKGLNQAVAAARSGARTAFVGALGRDAAGDRLREVLARDSIDLGHALTSDEPTGRAMISVDASGENSIVVIPGANRSCPARVVSPPAAVVLTQLEVPVDTVAAVIRSAAALGSITVLNPAPATVLPSELLASCDVIVPNEHEIQLLGGVDALMSAGCGTVIVTRGGAGVDVIDRGGRVHVDAFQVDVVDTTGAGDAFCGALAARLAAGVAMPQAVRWAAAAGALATTVSGAVPGQPSETAIRTLLDGARSR